MCLCEVGQTTKNTYSWVRRTDDSNKNMCSAAITTLKGRKIGNWANKIGVKKMKQPKKTKPLNEKQKQHLANLQTYRQFLGAMALLNACVTRQGFQTNVTTRFLQRLAEFNQVAIEQDLLLRVRFNFKELATNDSLLSFARNSQKLFINKRERNGN